MPPKSAAELALQEKYEALRKKKQDAGLIKQGSAQTAPSKEDAARAAAVKALQARRAAEEKAAASTSAAAKPAAGSQSPGGVKLKFVIPKREQDPPAADPQPQRSKSSTAAAPVRQPPPAAAASACNPPVASRPQAFLAGQHAAAARQHHPAAAIAEEAKEAGGTKRPSTAKRPTVRRPTPLLQQAQQASVDAGPPSGPALGDDVAGDYGQGGYGREADYYGREGGYGGRSYEEGGYGDEGYEGYDEEEQHAKRRRGDDSAGTSGRDRENCTLFVGDLPPNWASRDLEVYFAQFGTVRQARVMGSQCYGFVTYSTRQEAEALLESIQAQPLLLPGHGPVRLNWSQGSMPDWKKGPAVIRPRLPGEGPQGLESYEHPRIREARIAAQALITQQELAAVNLGAPPPEREMVAYDDL